MAVIRTRFTEEFVTELLSKINKYCKLNGAVIEVKLGTNFNETEIRSRRMMNKAPILNNFLSEIQGDIDLIIAYTNNKIQTYELVLYDYHYEGKIAVVRYTKNYIVSQ